MSDPRSTLEVPRYRRAGRSRIHVLATSTQTLVSGHRLGLRVFGPGAREEVRVLWHGTPDGEWRPYLDGTLDSIGLDEVTALHTATNARIMLAWPRRSVLHIRVDSPALDWTLRLRHATLRDRLAVLAARWARGPAHATALRESLRLAPVHPESGLPDAIGSVRPGLRATRLWVVAAARACLDGVDLGPASVLTTERASDNGRADRIGWLVSGSARGRGLGMPLTGPGVP